MAGAQLIHVISNAHDFLKHDSVHSDGVFGKSTK